MDEIQESFSPCYSQSRTLNLCVQARLELADYEAENLARLQKMFSRKWEFIFMQAEAQSKVSRNFIRIPGAVQDKQELSKATMQELSKVSKNLLKLPRAFQGKKELSKATMQLLSKV